MSAIRRISFNWTYGLTKVDTGDGTFIPCTGWMPAADFGKGRCTWEVIASTVAGMVTRPGYQVADVENSVASTNTLGNDTQSGNGVKYAAGMTDISSVTQTRALVRLGIWVKNPASDATLNALRVAGHFDIQSP